MADQVVDVYFKTMNVARRAVEMLDDHFKVSAPTQTEPYQGRPWMIEVTMPARRMGSGIDQRDFGIVLRVANNLDGLVHDDDPDRSTS